MTIKKPSFRIINFSVGIMTLIMFSITIGFFWVYVDETKQTLDETKETQQQMNASINTMNASINTILVKQQVRWDADNIRFNATLGALGTTYQDIQSLITHQAANQKESEILFNKTLEGINSTYALILDNQQKIIDLTNLQINLTDLQNNNTKNNLNLTKFNRATLVDSNNILRELAEYLNFTGLQPFDGNHIG